jgi:hypothetical protein
MVPEDDERRQQDREEDELRLAEERGIDRRRARRR